MCLRQSSRDLTEKEDRLHQAQIFQEEAAVITIQRASQALSCCSPLLHVTSRVSDNLDLHQVLPRALKGHSVLP